MVRASNIRRIEQLEKQTASESLELSDAGKRQMDRALSFYQSGHEGPPEKPYIKALWFLLLLEDYLDVNEDY